MEGDADSMRGDSGVSRLGWVIALIIMLAIIAIFWVIPVILLGWGR